MNFENICLKKHRSFEISSVNVSPNFSIVIKPNPFSIELQFALQNGCNFLEWSLFLVLRGFLKYSWMVHICPFFLIFVFFSRYLKSGRFCCHLKKINHEMLMFLMYSLLIYWLEHRFCAKFEYFVLA